VKKLIILLCLLFIPSVCSAEILDDFKSMRYRLEAGTNFRDYSTAYQQLYIEYRKSNNPKYQDLMNLYKELTESWAENIEGGSVTNYSSFVTKYRDNSCDASKLTSVSVLLCYTVKSAIKIENEIK